MEKKFKIVAKDNYDRENVSDYVVAENMNSYWAKKIFEHLEKLNSEYNETYLVLVPQEQMIYKFEP
jgi:hypothetical protein